MINQPKFCSSQLRLDLLCIVLSHLVFSKTRWVGERFLGWGNFFSEGRGFGSGRGFGLGIFLGRGIVLIGKIIWMNYVVGTM
jgi:hypothetical protein